MHMRKCLALFISPLLFPIIVVASEPPTVSECAGILIILEPTTSWANANLDRAWMLSVNSDGSGDLRFGSDVRYGANIESKNIDFAKVHHAARSCFTSCEQTIVEIDGSQTLARIIQVHFYGKEPPSRTSVCCEITTEIQEVFRLAENKAKPIIKEKFEEILRARPPFKP